MEDNLIDILTEFGYPVLRQRSLTPDEKYPEHFFTFWNNDAPDHSHYDNSEYGTGWDFDVNFYSTDPEKTYSVLAQARTKLKENKWIIPGQGYDVASDEITHTGRGLRAYYLQIQEV